MKCETVPDASIRLVERIDRAGHPEFALRQKRQLEEQRYRCCSEGYADPAVALIREAPRQCGTYVAEFLDRHRKVPVRFVADFLEETEKIACVTSRDRAGVSP